jgi:hypothetical protein
VALRSGGDLKCLVALLQEWRRLDFREHFDFSAHAFPVAMASKLRFGHDFHGAVGFIVLDENDE